MNVQDANINGKPTVISTFSGCGGSSLGYKLAGYKELLAIDFDKNSIETFKLNFPEVPCWERDIRQIRSEEILEFCNIKKEELDILDGSPPCQGFSTAGRRKVNDSRNDLFKEYIRLINELQPKVFVMENVSGMIKGKMRGRFIEIINELKKTGYKVKCKLLNAVNYGVPQARQRLFFIGIRPDINKEPIFPKPQSIKPITVQEAVKGIKPKLFEEISIDKYHYKLWLKLRPGENGSKYDIKGNYYGYIKLNPNKPSPTVIKTAGGFFHWKEPRTISIEEIKRIATFPDNFKFTGTYKQQWARIGNAVMPKQMEAIAKTIKEKIL